MTQNSHTDGNNATNVPDPVPGEIPDGSTDVTPRQQERVDALPDGSGSNEPNADGDEDTVSGGAPAPPEN
ncbi:MAG: hypothetical protein JWP30_499 [Homoserinimonas sp.]|nr:hypothetical protein [Homoserinimonas sp.]